MKRSRAFILSEQLMTIMLQASFIIVLCASFYQLISFYTKTQQVLTARNHAERVISFMDDKIRNAGGGLWRCKSSSAIREKFDKTGMLKTTNSNRGYKLPVAIQQGFENNKAPQDNIQYTQCHPQLSSAQNSGDILTVLYTKRSLSSGTDQYIYNTAAPLKLDNNTLCYEGNLPLLNRDNVISSKLFELGNNGVKSFAVMEAMGYPIYLVGKVTPPTTLKVQVFGIAANPSAEEITIPAASELIGLNCMQMLVHDTSDGRQFAYRELSDNGNAWNATYNQEKGILDIYMEVDREKNIFKLWVLASGGYDASMNNPRPETWPEKAQPTLAQWGKKKDKEYDYTDYPHHIVYVSRAQWKLNNIPNGFDWDN